MSLVGHLGLRSEAVNKRPFTAASDKWRGEFNLPAFVQNYFVPWTCWHVPSSKTNVVEPTDRLRADSERSSVLLQEEINPLPL